MGHSIDLDHMTIVEQMELAQTEAGAHGDRVAARIYQRALDGYPGSWALALEMLAEADAMGGE